MTREPDFTETEWEMLADLPRLAAFGAMAADDGGPVMSTRELWAGMMELAQAAQSRYPNSALIQEVADAVARGEEGAGVSRLGWKPGAEPLGNAVVEQALATAAEVRQVLAERVPAAEAAEYVAWVLGIARAATEAARSGLLGVVGEQVSAREAAFMRDLATTLGAT